MSVPPFISLTQQYHGIQISDEYWPVLWVRFSGNVTLHQVEEWLVSMDQALQRGEPYVIVMENGALLDFPLEGKKQQVLWFKANREAVASQCRGIVRIARDQIQADKLLRPQVQAAFPCPMKVVMSVEQALTMVDDLLAQG
ncbi:hypothetical protein [Hahella ganghwensis]|uniref:hypothetical protein n=1 Tax=Hahella ganghwensis TaxID=286420 RepID=UPI000376EE80|nr:hypothetical protein [Hahella ganghwensis]